MIQLILSILLLVLAGNNGMIPGKYLIPIGVVLVVLFGVAFGLQFLRGKGYIVGIVISILGRYPDGDEVSSLFIKQTNC
ncbi:MAG: hypothetical protein ACLRMN_02485 [Mediterraneibacter gnavus]